MDLSSSWRIWGPLALVRWLADTKKQAQKAEAFDYSEQTKRKAKRRGFHTWGICFWRYIDNNIQQAEKKRKSWRSKRNFWLLGRGKEKRRGWKKKSHERRLSLHNRWQRFVDKFLSLLHRTRPPNESRQLEGEKSQRDDVVTAVPGELIAFDPFFLMRANRRTWHFIDSNEHH